MGMPNESSHLAEPATDLEYRELIRSLVSALHSDDVFLRVNVQRHANELLARPESVAHQTVAHAQQHLIDYHMATVSMLEANNTQDLALINEASERLRQVAEGAQKFLEQGKTPVTPPSHDVAELQRRIEFLELQVRGANTMRDIYKGRLSRISDVVDGYVDGAPDASAASKLANEVAQHLEGFSSPASPAHDESRVGFPRIEPIHVDPPHPRFQAPGHGRPGPAVPGDN